MLIYIFLYMIGQRLNMGTAYWVLFWVCLAACIVITFAKTIYAAVSELISERKE